MLVMEMKALITGASSGIGKSMAYYLSELGYDLILVGRNKKALKELQDTIKTSSKVITMDLTDEKKVKELYVMTKEDNIDMLINNAGFGIFGEFSETNLNEELDMINLNVIAVHILTKLFLKDMINKNSGYILNVASQAAFGPGPLMATYYATKSYVNTLTESINEEIRRRNINVTVSSLCPGPVNTNFNNRAGVHFGVSSLESDDVAKYAIDQLLKKKVVIVPGFKMKLLMFGRRLASRKFIRKISYTIQEKKVD